MLVMAGLRCIAARRRSPCKGEQAEERRTSQRPRRLVHPAGRGHIGAGPGWETRNRRLRSPCHLVSSCASCVGGHRAPIEHRGTIRCSIDGRGGGVVEPSMQRTFRPLLRVDAGLQHTTARRSLGMRPDPDSAVDVGLPGAARARCGGGWSRAVAGSGGSPCLGTAGTGHGCCSAAAGAVSIHSFPSGDVTVRLCPGCPLAVRRSGVWLCRVVVLACRCPPGSGGRSVRSRW